MAGEPEDMAAAAPYLVQDTAVLNNNSVEEVHAIEMHTSADRAVFANDAVLDDGGHGTFTADRGIFTHQRVFFNDAAAG